MMAPIYWDIILQVEFDIMACQSIRMFSLLQNAAKTLQMFVQTMVQSFWTISL